jgi:hypothetical protein
LLGAKRTGDIDKEDGKRGTLCNYDGAHVL